MPFLFTYFVHARNARHTAKTSYVRYKVRARIALASLEGMGGDIKLSGEMNSSPRCTGQPICRVRPLVNGTTAVALTTESALFGVGRRNFSGYADGWVCIAGASLVAFHSVRGRTAQLLFLLLGGLRRRCGGPDCRPNVIAVARSVVYTNAIGGE